MKELKLPFLKLISVSLFKFAIKSLINVLLKLMKLKNLKVICAFQFLTYKIIYMFLFERKYVHFY